MLPLISYSCRLERDGAYLGRTPKENRAGLREGRALACGTVP